jgi:hypothetical protein
LQVCEKQKIVLLNKVTAGDANANTSVARIQTKSVEQPQCQSHDCNLFTITIANIIQTQWLLVCFNLIEDHQHMGKYF